MVDEHGGVPAAPGEVYFDEDLSPKFKKIVAEFDKRLSIQIDRMKRQCDAAEMPFKLQTGLTLNVVMHYGAIVATMAGVPRQSFLNGCRIHYDLASDEVTENEQQTQAKDAP
jgi:hypothetical protein